MILSYLFPFMICFWQDSGEKKWSQHTKIVIWYLILSAFVLCFVGLFPLLFCLLPFFILLVLRLLSAEVSPLWRLNRDNVVRTKIRYKNIRWVLPLPSNSQHKDCSILVGNPYKPSFPTVTGRGGQPKIYVTSKQYIEFAREWLFRSKHFKHFDKILGYSSPPTAVKRKNRYICNHH